MTSKAGISSRHQRYYATQPSMPSFPYDLVGLSGPMRSGKDTIADVLCQQYGFYKVRIASPLHQLWSICKMTGGAGERDRKLRQVHSILEDICQKIGSPIPYDHLNELTIYTVDLAQSIQSAYSWKDSDETQAKRQFLQELPDVLDSAYLGRPGIRSYTMWRVRYSLMRQQTLREQRIDAEDLADIPLPAVVIPDVRFLEEAYDLTSNGGKLFVLKVSPALLRTRISESGMKDFTEHPTERAVLDVMKSFPLDIIEIKKDTPLPPPAISSWLEEIGREDSEDPYPDQDRDNFGSW